MSGKAKTGTIKDSREKYKDHGVSYLMFWITFNLLNGKKYPERIESVMSYYKKPKVVEYPE